MRIVFMGTPAFALPALEALVEDAHAIAAVYTQPPRAGGRRGLAPTPSPVHRRAEELGLLVRHPASLREPEEVQRFAELGADLAVVVAYGLLLPAPVLATPRLGCVNIHASLLPRWRGAAPIQRAILAGDAATGVTLMQMDRGLDTGPMLDVSPPVPIDALTAGELADDLARRGALLLRQWLAAGAPRPGTPQAEAAEAPSYAAKIAKEEARLRFERPATELERQVRAFNPAPGAWCEIGGVRHKVLAAEIVAPTGAAGAPGVTLDDRLTIACGQGALRITQVQRAGRPAMPARELLRGHPVPAGTRVG